MIIKRTGNIVVVVDAVYGGGGLGDDFSAIIDVIVDMSGDVIVLLLGLLLHEYRSR